MNKFLYIILSLVLFLLSCQERDRNNIFDPQSKIDSLDLSLRISESDSLIRLAWSIPENINFQNFKIYRKLSSETSFSPIALLPHSANEFSDSIGKADILFEYYLTMIGEDSESPPSKHIKTIPGPGTFWILDRWDFGVLHLTYDLQHLINTKYAVWIPQALALTAHAGRALITYPQYHYFELFNPKNSQTLAGSDALSYPYDCVYDSSLCGFWLSDSSGGLYFYDPQNSQLEQRSLFPQKPLQIVSNSEQILMIDAKRQALLVFNKKENIIRTINHVDSTNFNNPYFIELDRRNHFIYLLDHGARSDLLYRLNGTLDEATLIYSAKYLDIVRADRKGDSVWLALHDENNAEILQLSNRLLRLIDLHGFKYISDFKISPYTNNLIIADPGQGKVFHYRSNGTLIGISKQALYPFKVYNE